MQVIMKAADVSNVAKPFATAREWTDRIMTEFYAQGVREKELGLPISACKK